jgi:hypothetical protein
MTAIEALKAYAAEPDKTTLKTLKLFLEKGLRLLMMLELSKKVN